MKEDEAKEFIAKHFKDYDKLFKNYQTKQLTYDFPDVYEVTPKRTNHDQQFLHRLSILKKLETKTIIEDTKPTQRHIKKPQSACLKSSVILTQERKTPAMKKRFYNNNNDQNGNPQRMKPVKSYTDPCITKTKKEERVRKKSSPSRNQKITPPLTQFITLNSHENKLLVKKLNDVSLKPFNTDSKNDHSSFKTIDKKDMLARKKTSILSHINRVSTSNLANNKDYRPTLRTQTSFDQAKQDKIGRYKTNNTISIRKINIKHLKLINNKVVIKNDTSKDNKTKNNFDESLQKGKAPTRKEVPVPKREKTILTSSPTKTKFYMNFVKTDHNFRIQDDFFDRSFKTLLT